MKTILIDSNILILAPEVLSLKSKNIKLVIIQPIYEELLSLSKRNSQYEDLHYLLSSAIGSKTVDLISDFTDKSSSSFSQLNKISFVDSLLLSTANEFISKGLDVYIATEDKRVHQAGEKFGIPIIGSHTLKKYLEEDSIVDKTSSDAALNFIRNQRKFVLYGFLGGVLTSSVAFFVWKNAEIILSTINVWGTISSILIVGVLVYWYRGRFLLSYALTEFLVGCFTATNVFYPSFELSPLDRTAYLKILAGLYIMVRGQDNIGKALQGSRYSKFWNRLSGKNYF